MPPKPNPKPDKNKTAVEEKPIDPTVDLKSLQHVTDLLAKAKTLRNYFQLERDKIHKFWDISRKELEDLKMKLLQSDHELEDHEGKHQVELQVYKQKVRHLMYEHRMQVQAIRQHSDEDIRAATEEHQKAMLTLRQQKQDIHQHITSAEDDHDDKVADVRGNHHRTFHTTNPLRYERNLQQTKEKYEQKISTLRDELELRRRAELHDIEEKKNEHINKLIQRHETAFAEMKAYYNQITSNNLELIRSLKEEIANMKRNDEHNETLMFDIERENQHLNEPLEIAKREVAELQQQLHNYEKDKLSLRNTRSRLRALHSDYALLQEEHEKLQSRYGKVQGDRDDLVGKFEAALRDAMDVVQDKTTAAQQELLDAHALVEQRDAQLRSVLEAINLEPAAVDAVSRQMEDALEAKNRAIKDLHFELRKVERQHRDVVGEYERRCRGSGIPVLDLEPLFQDN
jgi:DNA repair exonuclease SbcCD ATPase subunit